MKYVRLWQYFVLCLINTLFLGLPVLADPVQIKSAGLSLNGNLIPIEDKQKTVFLIVHGTWAHGAMELPATLQGLLEDEGYASLALTLSLGVDNRQGFFDCKSPVVHGHEEAVEEIHTWYLFLREQGYSRVVVIAHSRGGAQAALYQQRYPQDQLVALALIAPMSWQKEFVLEAYQEKFDVDLNALLEQAAQNNSSLFSPPGILYCDNTLVSPQAFISYYSEAPEKNTLRLLASGAIPTFVYLGSKDPLSEGFAKQQVLFDGKNKTSVVTIEGADHFFRDLYADELIDDLLLRLR